MYNTFECHQFKQNMDLFIGFGSGNALVLRLNNLKSTIETREAHNPSSGTNSLMDINDDDDEEMDDLYADEAPENGLTTNDSKGTVETVQPFDIELLSSLRNVGPITSLTVGKVSSIDDVVKGLPNPKKRVFASYHIGKWFRFSFDRHTD
ncbi:Protein CFT1 domain protein [Saccharomyces cerevisiae]|nr:Protein CFT1 domain protein [Saccharomyces cerevisiae]